MVHKRGLIFCRRCLNLCSFSTISLMDWHWAHSSYLPVSDSYCLLRMFVLPFRHACILPFHLREPHRYDLIKDKHKGFLCNTSVQGERGGLVVNDSDSGSRGRGFEPHSGQTVLCP